MNDSDDTTAPQEEETSENELDLARKKIEELEGQALRAMADLQNYKKRAEEEKQSFMKFATAGVFLEILPVFDSFERAAAHLPEDLVESDWVKGIQSIIKQFEQIMEKFRITKMKTVGEKFNTDFHEAIASGPGEKDVVIEELESGYMIEDKTLRPAKVKVGDGS